jgi:FkbM family methyltransferase
MSLKTMVGKAGRNVLGRDLYMRLRVGRHHEYRFLRNIRGVMHVGASTGQEAELYKSFGLEVLWVEPIPEVFAELSRYVAQFPGQKAVNYLVTDEDNREHCLHISNNGGESSSILDFSKHSEMWPDVKYTRSITLKGITLGTLLKQERIDLSRFDALILDTQGSEMKILRGAAEVLPNFKFVKIEVPDFESYKECCQVAELSAFMASQGFREDVRVPFMHASNVGTYFDVVYKRA